MHKGKLYIVASPSGAGKTSLVKALVESTPHIHISVSHTTRPIRPSETDGASYHFVKPAVFKNMLGNDLFLEHAKVFGNLYGTSELWVKEKLNQCEDVILEIDWQGAQQIRKLMPEAVSIFVLPPSRDALHERLVGRAQDSDDIIMQRVGQAVTEMSHYSEFEYIVVNEEFDLALRDLQTIIRSHRLSVAWIQHYRKGLLDSLLHQSHILH
ncbi:MAG: guanylate kinase [Candidatus Endonucleobacter bathymodioli]|uniref:Guanylate kinase n=1 Tax=Candidatus Endonucleibacter bathymodioli TaxID=539814 RepID=A0AA90SN01_9GAMM|nr:guanylate kinase [Candidatus Endonucleobacter bathymodioli]